MKGRAVILDEYQGRQAAALMVDGRLEDLLIDPPDDRPLPGAIYRATADRPMKGQGGIFVRLPGQNGWLRGSDGISAGKPLIVQVTGPAEGAKAVPVTTRLLFKSRFAIVTPAAPGLNISRRIRDEALRAELTALAEAGMAGADPAMGLILRSACWDAEAEAVAEDIAAMRALAEAVTSDLTGGPELLVEGAGAHETAFRDWLDPEPDAMEAEPGSFSAHGVVDAIDGLRHGLVALDGGSMVIEPTTALTAIDVNTGADTSPAAGLKTNIAAARDLPRQLRLRGLGGQVVIDFAPMAKRDRGILDQVMKAAFKTEGEVNLAGWTTLGLYEMTRRRDRLPLADLL